VLCTHHTYLIVFRYARKAFKRLDLFFPDDQNVVDGEIAEMLNQWNKVIVLFTLAQMLGPVVETVILLDRVIYLAENGKFKDINLFFVYVNFNFFLCWNIRSRFIDYRHMQINSL